MTFEEFLVICKLKAQALGLKFIKTNGVRREIRAVGAIDGVKVCHCPVSLCTECIDDFCNPAPAAKSKLGLSAVDSINIPVAADHQECDLSICLAKYRRRMLEAWDLEPDDA